MGTYNPREVQSYSKKQIKEGEWNRVDRFKTEKTGTGKELGPGRYFNFSDWTKQNKIASRIPYKSTYYH